MTEFQKFLLVAAIGCGAMLWWFIRQACKPVDKSADLWQWVWSEEDDEKPSDTQAS
jgi:hypothetical protein